MQKTRKQGRCLFLNTGKTEEMAAQVNVELLAGDLSTFTNHTSSSSTAIRHQFES
jgi:hypothetical protein